MKEQNYGADWGDYVSFVKDMRAKAKAYDVDLLLVDTGVSGIENAAQAKLIAILTGPTRWRRPE